jgi:hypothetical protein
MKELLDNPAIQAGVAPLVVGLIVAALLWRTRAAWLGIVAAFATMVALSTGFSFIPLSAGRKILLLTLLVPFVGLALDAAKVNARRWSAILSVIVALASFWVFASIFAQREGRALYLVAMGIAAYVGVLVYLTTRLRDDGVRTGAAGVGLGVGIGVAAVLSASIGFLLDGIAIAAGSGALLLCVVLLNRQNPPALTGTLSVGVPCALFAAGALMLADLPWYALPLSLLIPLLVALPLPRETLRIARGAAAVGYAIFGAVILIIAAWYAAHGSLL